MRPDEKFYKIHDDSILEINKDREEYTDPFKNKRLTNLYVLYSGIDLCNLKPNEDHFSQPNSYFS